MYLFLLFFPILYIPLLYTLRITVLSAQDQVKLFTIISVLCVPIASITLLLFRFFISKAYTLFTMQYITLYTLIAFFSYFPILFFIQRIVRHTMFEKKEYMLITICVLEFWFALGSLLIAHNFFTYREYFFYPIFRMSIAMSCAFAIISRRMIYVFSALVITIIGIITMFLAIYVHVIQAIILVLIAVFLHVSVLIYYTVLRHENFGVQNIHLESS